ncbi:MAG: hypothetical protein ACM3NF_09265 [Gemmatimonadota bacterium]
MIRVKTFTSQLKIFHTTQELEALDRTVNDFLAAGRIRNVVSVADTATTGADGASIGLIRVVAYEDPAAREREKHLEKLEGRLKDWGAEVEKLRAKADKLGAAAGERYRGQVDELKARQDAARQKLQELARSGGEAWDDLKSGAETALEELKKGVEGAVARLKKR